MLRKSIALAILGLTVFAVGCSKGDDAASADNTSATTKDSAASNTNAAPPTTSTAPAPGGNTGGTGAPQAQQGGHFINPNSSGMPQAGSAIKGR